MASSDGYQQRQVVVESDCLSSTTADCEEDALFEEDDGAELPGGHARRPEVRPRNPNDANGTLALPSVRPPARGPHRTVRSANGCCMQTT